MTVYSYLYYIGIYAIYNVICVCLARQTINTTKERPLECYYGYESKSNRLKTGISFWVNVFHFFFVLLLFMGRKLKIPMRLEIFADKIINIYRIEYKCTADYRLFNTLSIRNVFYDYSFLSVQFPFHFYISLCACVRWRLFPSFYFIFSTGKISIAYYIVYLNIYRR